jgi:Fe-S-cluster formation regulator IscX/YfhJ
MPDGQRIAIWLAGVVPEADPSTARWRDTVSG